MNIAELNSSSEEKMFERNMLCICYVSTSSENVPLKVSNGVLWNLIRKPYNGILLAVSGIFRSIMYSQHWKKHVSLTCVMTYHNSLVVLTLKTIPSKMISTITGKVESFKGKVSVLWFEGLCGIAVLRPRPGVSLSLASDGLQCTVQYGCCAIWQASGAFCKKKGIENWN